VAPGAAIVRAAIGDARAAISLAVSRPIPATMPAGSAVSPPTPPPPQAPVTATRRRRNGLWVVAGIVVAIAVGAGVGIALWAPLTPAADAPPQEPQTVFVAAAKGVRFIDITGAEPLQVGQTSRLHGIASDANHRPVSSAPIVWSSDDPAIATVDAKTGAVTAVAAGTAHVRATAAGREATVSLTVH
jgi:hypothetical protein